jgi:hypothetical protein
MISDGGFNIGLRLGIPSRHLIGFNTFWKSNGPRIWMMTGCSPILGNTQSWGNKKRIQDIMVIWGSFNHGDLFCSCFFFQDDLCWSKQTHKQYFESWELANGLTNIDMGCVQGMFRHFWVISHIGKGLATMYSHNHGLVESYWINGKSLLQVTILLRNLW